MSLMLTYASKRLCSACAAVNFDGVFDSGPFDGLAPLHSPGATAWPKYVRKILTFTRESLQTSGNSCTLCSFLRTVSSIAENYKVPSVLSHYTWPTTEVIKPGDPKLQDGNGFTLAATSSHFIYPICQRDQAPPSHLTDYPASPNRPHQPGKAAVWLIVLKGSNTLERVAYELKLRGYSNVPLPLLTQIALCVRNTGTWIAEASGDDIFEAPASIRARLVVPGRINYNLLRSWLDSCTKNHPSCAGSVRNKAVPHMKLIDCRTRTLVAAEPSMQYLALSYVWGTGTLEKYDYPSLPSTLPPTIEDSIKVALELGIRYIWIDRYCIWQDDPVHKTTQILHMTQIYGDALATIAASNSGPGPQYGLPGVSTARSRTPGLQIVGRLGPRLLVSGAIQRRQEEAVRKSAWDTRAWTFQEATLSPRILFFSDCEVSFLCPASEAFEHLAHPIALLNPDGATRKSTYLTGVVEHDGVKSLVWRYSTRKMTFSSDALNAFAGVLSRWSAANENCHHYWGVPMRFPKRVEEDCVDSELCEPLWNALCWRLDTGAVRPGARRERFPTWSWLAIDGRITVNTNWDLRKETSGATYRFGVSSERSGMVDWCDFVRTGGLSLSPFSWGPALRIEGWVFSVGPFVKVVFPPQTLYYVKLETVYEPLTTKTTAVLQFLPDFGTASPERFLTDRLEAVAAYTYTYSDENYAIVLESVAGVRKRIGLLQLGLRTLTDRDMPVAIPTDTCDIKQVFDARRDVVCLE